MIKLTSKQAVLFILLVTLFIDLIFATTSSIIFIQYSVGSILLYSWYWKLALGVLITNGILLIIALATYIYSRSYFNIKNTEAEQRKLQASKKTTAEEYNKQVARAKKR